MFALRTSVATFPLLTLILWRGAGARLLTAAAAVLLGGGRAAALPHRLPEDRGGYDFEYSLQVIDAHWVGEGALVLLMAACWRAIGDARAGATSARRRLLEPRRPVPSPPLRGQLAPLPPR